jgi:hypothetical protein
MVGLRHQPRFVRPPMVVPRAQVRWFRGRAPFLPALSCAVLAGFHPRWRSTRQGRPPGAARALVLPRCQARSASGTDSGRNPSGSPQNRLCAVPCATGRRIRQESGLETRRRSIASGRRGRSTRTDTGGQLSRSPASIRRSRRFSGGASGHDQRGSNAHDGWNAKLKSRIRDCAAVPGPRSALLAVSSRYRPAP